MPKNFGTIKNPDSELIESVTKKIKKVVKPKLCPFILAPVKARGLSISDCRCIREKCQMWNSESKDCGLKGA